MAHWENPFWHLPETLPGDFVRLKSDAHFSNRKLEAASARACKKYVVMCKRKAPCLVCVNERNNRFTRAKAHFTTAQWLPVEILEKIA